MNEKDYKEHLKGICCVEVSGESCANCLTLMPILEELCSARGVEFCRPSLSLCSDNAAMVAAAGYFEYIEGHFADSSLNASANDDGN